MRRTVGACLLPAIAICAAWVATEDPRRVGEAALVALLAVLPALLPRLTLRLSAVAVGGAGVAWLAFDGATWELHRSREARFLEPLVDAVYTGVGDFSGVVLPFDPVRHPEMHALVLVAVFAFVSALVLLIASDRPFAAAAVTVAGVGWPATLMDAGAVAIGALALVAALWIFSVRRVHTPGGIVVGALLSCAVVLGAAWLSSVTSIARGTAVAWEAWDFGGLPVKALGVRFVWNASYDGISFPPTKTTVLEIAGPTRPQYWRVSTLDLFTADRWFEELLPRAAGDAESLVPQETLAPTAARDRSQWVEQEVTVKALVDDRIAAAGTPVALDGPALGTVFYLSGGVVRARGALDPGVRYRVWSYVPDPSPAELAAAPPRYPAGTRRFLAVWGRDLPPFGREGREARVKAMLADPEWAALAEYRRLNDVALRVTRQAPNPYEAVLAIESWLRRAGGFRYDQKPTRTYDLPPLVEFVTETKAGYCQHFAGAMALMLRFLGIPARVAVGFTSGVFDGRRWNVTDHDAHAWVEVWFPDQGWVAFDPTPGRGTFAGVYSFASESAQAVAGLDRGVRANRSPSDGRAVSDSASSAIEASRGGGNAPPLLGLALLAVALWLFGVWIAKTIVVRRRRMTRDPRRAATASRKELEGFLRDQGVEIPPSATLAWLQGASREELGLDVRAFAASAARGRFGPPAEASRGAEIARRELRIALRSARRKLSPWARVRGFVSLRSLRGRGAV